MSYYFYRDLQRGWRVTAPNLEDCGLLAFAYEGLKGEEGLLGETALWEVGFSVRLDRNNEQFIETPAPLRSCPPELREEILCTLLDVLRRTLAVNVNVLDQQKQLDLVEQTTPRLLEDTVWYLEDAQGLERAVVAYPPSKQAHEQDRTGFFISSDVAANQLWSTHTARVGALTTSITSASPRRWSQGSSHHRGLISATTIWCAPMFTPSGWKWPSRT